MGEVHGGQQSRWAGDRDVGMLLPWERYGAVLPAKMRGWTELQGVATFRAGPGRAGGADNPPVMQKQARGEVCGKEASGSIDPAGVWGRSQKHGTQG